MRVLHVIAGVAPRYGGPSQAVVAMCKGLHRRGVDTLIATTDADGPTTLDVPLGVETSYEGVRAIFFRRQWAESFKISLPLARWLDEQVPAFDVVHIHAVFNHPCVAAAGACRNQGVPYIVRPLGTLDRWSLSQKWLRKRLFWYAVGRRMLRQAAAVHYTAENERLDTEDTLGLDRGVVIPLGVDSEVSVDRARAQSFREMIPGLADRPYVLVLSRLHPVKALDVLVDAFVDATEGPELGHWKLVIAGGGDPEYAASLTAQAAARQASSRVLLTGWLDGERKAGALSGAELLALASRHENFGLSIAEAFSHGVPVLVSSNVKLADDIALAGAGWITTLNRGGLSEELGAALRDAAERKRRGRAGRRLALEKFSWSTVARQLIDLYRSVSVREGYAVATRLLP